MKRAADVRRKTLVNLGAATLLLIACGELRAQDAIADNVPSYDTLVLASRILGEPRRRINVHTPKGYADARGKRFPVLYMPDGGLDEDFSHVVNTVDSLIALGAIRPVIVVGVPNTERRRDLTGPTRVAKDSTIAPHVGGSGAFRHFIRDALIPAIDARYRTTPERALVGESLAGLFVVETFLREPARHSEADETGCGRATQDARETRGRDNAPRRVWRAARAGRDRRCRSIVRYARTGVANSR